MTQGRKFAYSYDNNGNQLTRSQKNGKAWTQGWDAENRLIEVSRTSGADSSIVTFKYDPFGRRIEKQIINTFNGDTISKTVNYVYDAEDIVLQVEEVTHDSTTTTTETRFIHGPGIDEPLAFVRDGQSYFYHADGLGSIVAITDSTQAIAQKYSYESFGLPTPQTTLKQPYMFTGREWDAEIGLYFYRARYYDPMEGRFIGKDPLAIRGNIYTQGVSVSFSQYLEAVTTPYLYTGNSPINLTDPSGLASYSSAEGHFVVGGGLLEVKCCTENGEELKHVYLKICLGAAFEVSGGRGAVSNSDGKSCSSPPVNMLGGEASASFVSGVAGGEVAGTVDMGGGGFSSSGGGGVSLGIPVKANACYYRLINTAKTGEECCE